MTLSQKTDQELLKAYEVGSKWISNRMQVTGTDKNELGEKYDHISFLLGLNRLGEVQDELNRRGIKYGK